MTLDPWSDERLEHLLKQLDLPDAPSDLLSSVMAAVHQRAAQPAFEARELGICLALCASVGLFLLPTWDSQLQETLSQASVLWKLSSALSVSGAALWAAHPLTTASFALTAAALGLVALRRALVQGEAR